MSDSVVLSDKIREFINKTSERQSDQTALVYRQALQLFSSFIHTGYGIISEQDSPTILKTEHLISYLEFLQQNKSIETEHLYSRGVFLFYLFVFNWNELSPEYSNLVNYLDEHRREKEYNIPSIPLSIIEKMLEKARYFPIPIGADVAEREKLIILRDKAYILLLSETGLRVSEMCDLKRENFSINKRSIILPDGTEYPLSEHTQAALRSYISARMNTDGAQQSSLLGKLPLFTRHDKKAGKRILPLSRWTGANIITFWLTTTLTPEEIKDLESDEMTISPHTFRHYFILRQLQESKDIKKIQELARHSDRSTTKRYQTLLDSNSAD